jgi:hypothetical protein
VSGATCSPISTAGYSAPLLILDSRDLWGGNQFTRPISPTLHRGVVCRGTAYLTYRAAAPGGTPHPALWARTWTTDGRLGPPRRIAPRAHDVVRATSRTDVAGDTMVAWSRLTGPATVTLFSRVMRRDGSCGPVHKVGAVEAADIYHPVPSPAPGLAVDDDGAGIVVWPSEPEPSISPPGRGRSVKTGRSAPG